WQGSGVVAIVAGIVICFWGYRLWKLTLAIIGLIAGACGGWQVGLALVPGNEAGLLVCGIVGALAGMGLCLWLYFLGLFLIGATAGAVIAGALVNGTGQGEPLVFVGFPLIFRIIAVVAPKIIVGVSTGPSGAYLISPGDLSVVP